MCSGHDRLNSMSRMVKFHVKRQQLFVNFEKELYSSYAFDIIYLFSFKFHFPVALRIKGMVKVS